MPIVQEEVEKYIELWNLHAIRKQPKRPNVVIGKPKVNYLYPVGTTWGCMYMRSVKRRWIVRWWFLEYMRKHSYLSPSLRQWLIVSSIQRDGNSLSPLISFLYTVLPRGESKECVLPLLQQRSVCYRCCSKGVCVAAIAAKECVLLLLQQRSVCCYYCSKGVCVAAITAKECVLLLLWQRSEVSHVVKGTVF
jgi:hypothetical protein